MAHQTNATDEDCDPINPLSIPTAPKAPAVSAGIRTLIGLALAAALVAVMAVDWWFEWNAATGTSWLSALLADGLVVAVVIAAVAAVALGEFCRIAERLGASLSRPLVMGGGGALALLLWVGWAGSDYGRFLVCPPWLRDPSLTAVVALCGVAFGTLALQAVRGRMAGSAEAAAFGLLGLVYIPIALGFVAAIRVRWGPAAVLMLLATCKMTDVGAYYAGKFIGGPKMAPAVSPNKTFAGAAGGIVAGTVVAGVIAWLWWDMLTPVTGVVYGAMLAVVAILGDLAESLLKRQAGVKDSGNLLPGAGGMLDIVDDVLFAAPFSYVFFAIVYSMQ